MIAEIDPSKVKTYNEILMPSFSVSVENQEMDHSLANISLSKDDNGMQVSGG